MKVRWAFCFIKN